MEQKELWGIGRTWIAAYALLVFAFAVFLLARIDFDQLISLVTIAIGVGGVKSTAIGITERIAKPKNGGSNANDV